jgi:DNA-binding NtrC family response regulator
MQIDLCAKSKVLADGLRRFGTLYGSSPAMCELYDMVLKVAPTTATVFIVGESGCGKELVATTIHQMSPRAERPFVAVNCGSIPTNLIEAELFGHEKGSFTGALRQHKGYFERALNGTLFLDEITEMPLEMQAKLLRALETGRFSRVGGDGEIESHVRIIAATNLTPAVALKRQKLREDLLYRLSVFPIHVPALRERGNDIVALAEFFLAGLNAESGLEKRLSASATQALSAHAWPGNVRELKNVIQRAYIMADNVLEIDDLPALAPPGEAVVNASCVSIPVGLTLAEVERQLICATLEQYRGNKRQAAAILGISLKTLYNKLTAYRSDTRVERDITISAGWLPGTPRLTKQLNSTGFPE